MDSQFSKANIFKDVKQIELPRHEFDQSFTNSFTMNHGLLYPNLVDLVKPGDLIDVKSFGRVQLTPLATSSMQNIRFYQRYFYIPLRILWDRFDDFISQDGFGETNILAPYTTLNGDTLNVALKNYRTNLLDYLGVGFENRNESNEIIPYDNDAQITFNLFPYLAYNHVWDTYFRDENIQSTVFDLSRVLSGYNNASNLKLFDFLPIAKEKDYFTTALPWTQKGQPVTLGTTIDLPSIPVKWNSFNLNDNSQMTDLIFQPIVTKSRIINNQDGIATYNTQFPSTLLSTDLQTDNSINVSAGRLQTDSSNTITSDDYLLSPYISQQQFTSSSFNINELRYANALQRYLERLALGGNRPAEFYLSMYGVQVDDLRIGQPKYLGGGSCYVHVTSIPQTSESMNTPQATLAGNGQANLNMQFNEPYYCQEFGILLGVCYIRPELNYSQGLPRILQIIEHLDFYNPIFAHLGEEEVRTSELMLKSDIKINPGLPELNNDDTFGYQSRYAYLKARRNEIHGELKNTLNDWMLSQNFISPPKLNSSFIIQPQNYDIFAVTDATDHYIVEIRHEYHMVSNMPDFSIPSL